MRKYLIIILACFAVGCVASSSELRSGDLVFEQAQPESGDFVEAIDAATSRDGNAKSFIHVGIIEVANDGIFVIEASPQNGVCRTSFDEFVASSGVLTFMRLTGDWDSAATVDRAKAHIGEPYDLYFLPDNGQMYCSELVYESYLDADFKHIFEARPMNFRAADGSMPEYWLELFEQLGEPVPEGVAGTNPNDLSHDPRLREVAVR